jgi:DNA-binding SARP family transcriptional activator
MLNGDVDLQTPLESAERAKKDWPNSVFLTIEDATHVTISTSECALGVALSFLEKSGTPRPPNLRLKPTSRPAKACDQRALGAPSATGMRSACGVSRPSTPSRTRPDARLVRRHDLCRPALTIGAAAYASPVTLRVRLLGGLRVENGGGVPAARPARLLLGWLAAVSGAHARGEVAARLWPDVLDESARASLRTALSDLRAALGPAGVHVWATRETVELGGDGLWIDLRAFAELVALGRLEEALALCRGEVLEGLDEEWVLDLRSRHAGKRADAAVELIRAAKQAGDAAVALAWARRLVAWDPLDETAQRELMLALDEAGDRAAALRSYADFTRRLARELRVAPSGATRELASRLRRRGFEVNVDDLPFPRRLELATGGAFAGREAAIARLHEALAIARGGERCAVYVAGEAGIGKTRLLGEFARAIHGRGALVLYGRCEEEPGGPYQPFVEALEPVADWETLSAGLGQPGGGRPGAPDADPAGDRARLFDAIAEWLEELARVRPLVLVLDDLHWAEPATLLLLRRLATRPHRSALLLVGSARDTEVGPAHLLTATIAHIRRDRPVVRIALQGLDDAAVAAVVEEVMGTRPDRAVARTLRERTAGNPFFARELAHHAADAASLPQSVLEVVGARVARLAAGTQRLLELAAVAGSDFDAELLRAGSGEAEDSVLDAIDEALRARLLRELPEGRLAFVHDLVRDVLTRSLSSPRRAYLHGRVSAVLTERARRAPGRWLARLAHHALAAASDETEPAVGYALDAARLAVERLAWEDAIDLLLRAEALARKAAAPPERLAEVLVALGDARLRAGEGDAGRAVFEEAARLARAGARHDLLAHAALGAAGLGVTIVAVDEPLIELLDEALAALGSEPTALHVRVLSRLAIALAYAPAEERRRALVEKAVATARMLRDPGALAVALTASHVVHWAPEHLSARMAAADELVVLGERVGDAEIELHGRHWRIVDLLDGGEVAAAESEIVRYEREAAEARLPTFSWYAPAWRAALAGYRGDLAVARRLADQAQAQGARTGDENAQLVVTASLYMQWIVQEAWGEFDLSYVRARIDSPAGRSYRAYLALCLAELGDQEAARALLAEAAAEGFEHMPRDANLLIGLAQLAEACAALGDGERAAAVVPLLEPFADRMVSFVRATGLAGSAARPLGRALAAAGRTGDAVDALEAAIAYDRARGGIPFAARAQRDLAEVLLARSAPGDRARAGELLKEAVEAGDRLGLAEPVRRALVLASAATAAPPARG